MLGAIAGLWRMGEELLDSSMQMLRTIPFLALVPLFIVWLGIGETPKIVLIALATVFPMYLNTYNGVRSVDRKVLEGMRSFGVTGWRLVRDVVFPLAAAVDPHRVAVARSACRCWPSSRPSRSTRAPASAT